MFKLQHSPTFKTRVKLSLPGQERPAEIVVEFRHLTRPEIAAFFQNAVGKTDAEVFPQIVVGWEGVDEAFSAEALAYLLDHYPAAAGELLDAFRRECLESRVKN